MSQVATKTIVSQYFDSNRGSKLMLGSYGSTLAERKKKKDYGSARAYAEAVRDWQKKTYDWLKAQNDDFVARNNVNPSLVQSGLNLSEIRPQVVINQVNVNIHHREVDALVTERYTIPSYWRRITAEIIDFVMLFVLKVGIVYSLVQMEYIAVDSLENYILPTADFYTILDIATGNLPYELLSKAISTSFEILCLNYGFFICPKGTTPGKLMLDIKVIRVEDIQPLTPDASEVQVRRWSRIGFRRSVFRTFLKHLINTFMFPLGIFAYAFAFNRAFHDLQAGTLVVSLDPTQIME
uniref:RDD domain-containing protein n=1 Tax=Bursaphelenchus xylophilus TaxID=6326 RepID=A0A1I7RJL5_BURXY